MKAALIFFLIDILLFVVFSFIIWLNFKERKAEREKENEKTKKQNKAKEKLNGGNNHDNVVNSLNMLK